MACSPGDLSLAAMSALTAALPALRCSANSPRGPAAARATASGGSSPAFGEGVAHLDFRSVGRLTRADHVPRVADATSPFKLR